MDADLDARLIRLLTGSIAAQDRPGAVVGVYRDGELVSSAAVGLARLDPPTPLTTSTVFDLASVSKQMTAATLVLLAQEGMLELDDQVCEYLPVVTAGITLRHCLQHTSFLPDYLSLAELVGASAEEACDLDSFARALPELCRMAQFEPGAGIRYSNTGYVVAALVAEQVSGRRWDELVFARVLHPLSMHASWVELAVTEPGPGVAVGHTVMPDGSVAVDQLGGGSLPTGTRHTIGDGEVKATIEDMAAWYGFLADGRILGSDVREQLLAPATLSDGRSTSYGMGLWWSEFAGMTTYGHSGSVWGYRAHSMTELATGTGVCVLANTSEVEVGTLAQRALREALDRRGTSATWVSVAPPLTIETSLADDGGLLVDGGGEQRLTRMGEDVWVGGRQLRRVALRGEELVVVDNLGASVVLRRCVPTDATPPHALVGRYVSERPATQLDVREVGGTWWLTVGQDPSERLHHLGQVAGCHAFRAGGRMLLFGSDTVDEVWLSDGTVSLPYRRDPRS